MSETNLARAIKRAAVEVTKRNVVRAGEVALAVWRELNLSDSEFASMGDGPGARRRIDAHCLKIRSAWKLGHITLDEGEMLREHLGWFCAWPSFDDGPYDLPYELE